MTPVITAWIHALDQIGMDDPDNNEGHPEDRCNVCERPMIDHPARGGRRAKWPHRRAVLAGILLGQL